MKLTNKPKVLAATYNPVSQTKMFSVMVDFPTGLLAELRTHRILTQGSLYEHSELNDFNMSASSARAIPVNKYINKVEANPHQWIWTSKKAGMSGGSVTEEQVEIFQKIQEEKLKFNVEKTKELIEAGCHKQQANRGLSEFAYTTCILSGTEWENFFELRCPKYNIFSENVPMEFKSKKELLKYVHAVEAEEFKNQYDSLLEEDWQSMNNSTAQPEFQVIAEMLYDLYQEADWKENKYHIPFREYIDKLYHKEISNENDFDKGMNLAMKIAASMCAKFSYNTQDNEDTLEKHLERANLLIARRHYEPFSHQAVAMDEEDYSDFYRVFRVNKDFKDYSHKLRETENSITVSQNGWCFNIRGFISQRYIIENL